MRTRRISNKCRENTRTVRASIELSWEAFRVRGGGLRFVGTRVSFVMCVARAQLYFGERDCRKKRGKRLSWRERRLECCRTQRKAEQVLVKGALGRVSRFSSVGANYAKWALG